MCICIFYDKEDAVGRGLINFVGDRELQKELIIYLSHISL